MKTLFTGDEIAVFQELEDDIERFPLPLCFDEREEQGQLYGRHTRLQELAKRYVRFRDYKLNKSAQPC